MLSRVSGVPGHVRNGSAGTSFSDAASAVKERTKEGFAKMFKGMQSWGEGQGGTPS